MKEPAAADMDVKAAISTIERALSYTAPLRRRTEGVTWILFGLSSALFVFSYAWVWNSGSDAGYRLIFVWLGAYALLGVGPGILAWRIASVVDDAYAVDTKRLVAGIVVGGLVLVALDFALWAAFGETRLSIALNIVLLGSAVWAALGLTQWARLSPEGRRDSVVIGVAMAATGFALVYALRATAATVDLDVTIFALCNGLLPFLAGVWRLARG